MASFGTVGISDREIESIRAIERTLMDSHVKPSISLIVRAALRYFAEASPVRQAEMVLGAKVPRKNARKTHETAEESEYRWQSRVDAETDLGDMLYDDDGKRCVINGEPHEFTRLRMGGSVEDGKKYKGGSGMHASRLEAAIIGALERLSNEDPDQQRAEGVVAKEAGYDIGAVRLALHRMAEDGRVARVYRGGRLGWQKKERES